MSNEVQKLGKNGAILLAVWAGRFCSFVACFSLLVSLGMPGVGWMMATLTLVANSVLIPWSGRRYAILTLAVTLIHLLTVGPLSLSLSGQSETAKLPGVVLVSFVVLPIGIACIFIAASIFKLKKK